MKVETLSSEHKDLKSFPTNRIAMMQDADTSPESQTYKLRKLPKHFKKKFYQGFEPRFVIILMCSIFLHSAIFLYLSNHLPKKNKANITEKVRKQFARLLLDGKTEFPSAIEKFGEESPGVDPNFSLLESFVSEFENYELPIDNLLNFAEATSPVTKRPSAETNRLNREERIERRGKSRDAVFEEIQRIGLLAVLTSGSGVVSHAEIADILQFADSTAGDLEKRLAFLTSLRIPRAEDPIGFKTIEQRRAPALLAGSEIVSKVPSIKGDRVYTANVRVNDFVEKLGVVKEVPVKKTQRYETVPSSFALSSLNGSPTNGHVRRFTRDPNEVKEVVLSHYTAIQDCYTQALKTNPYLRGKVVVRFVVSPGGNVISASVVSSSIDDPQMIECMLDRILRWNDFSPLHPSAANMTIKQTYVFGF
jgi:TonB family protein